MATQPGWAYPVIISMAMGWGQMGLGQGVLGNHTQRPGVSMRFSSEWDIAAREILPRLIPAGFPVLCNYLLACRPLSSRSPHAGPLPSLFLN